MLFFLPRCNIWIQSSGRPELADKTAVYEDRICELHFDESMFLNDYRNRLHQSAVPNPLLVPKASLAAPTDSVCVFFFLLNTKYNNINLPIDFRRPVRNHRRNESNTIWEPVEWQK